MTAEWGTAAIIHFSVIFWLQAHGRHPHSAEEGATRVAIRLMGIAPQKAQGVTHVAVGPQRPTMWRTPREIRARGGTNHCYNILTFGYSGWGIGTATPEYCDRWAAHTGRCEGATAEKAVPFPGRLPIDSHRLVRFAALNPFYGAGPVTRGASGGDGRVFRRKRHAQDGLSAAKFVQSSSGMTFLRTSFRSLLPKHDLFRKPVSKFRDHARD